ncbi:hypothetical protein C9374_001339 [Naegleria lovaniensis]|uniref:Stress response protein NST1 n=1 Tax=Naegleria lovaniensis TaxID=51637 RepID=A0AA88KLC9_NAELO|nr:uncharacterized protein C9374_001339 [Naegleria lovaniensis]KAG2387745.1 hypothetical protein C9374_001339 [Naegleria lovaniensis]
MPSKKSTHGKKKSNSSSKSQSKGDKTAPQVSSSKRSDSQTTSLHDFWRRLNSTTRKRLFNVDAYVLLKKIKAQYQRVCSCTVCGRNKTILDRELERLFTEYCKELAYPDHNNECQFNFCTTVDRSSKLRNNNNSNRTPKTTKRTVINKDGTEMLTTTTFKKSGNVRVIEKTVKYYSTTKFNPSDNNGFPSKPTSPIIEDITDDSKDRSAPSKQQINSTADTTSTTPSTTASTTSTQNVAQNGTSSQQNLPPPPPPYPSEELSQEDLAQYEFGKNLSISKDAIITLSEEWVKHHESSDVIQLLQRFEHSIKQSNLENLILNKDKKNNNNNASEDDEYEDDDNEEDDVDEDDQECSEEEDDEQEEEDEETEEEEEDEESECESENSEENILKWRESRRVFHLFAAKAFYDNILNAFKEKQALDMQAKLIEEEEIKEKEKSEKKMKKKKEQEKKKQEQEKQKKMEEERKKIEKEMIDIIKKEKQKKREVHKDVHEVESPHSDDQATEPQQPEITHILFENDMSDVSIKVTPEQFPRYQPKSNINDKKSAKPVKKVTEDSSKSMASCNTSSSQSSQVTAPMDTISSSDTMSSGNSSVNTQHPPVVTPSNIVSVNDQIVTTSSDPKLNGARKSPSPPNHPNNQPNNAFNNGWQPMSNAFQFGKPLLNPAEMSLNNSSFHFTGGNNFQNPQQHAGNYQSTQTQQPSLFGHFNSNANQPASQFNLFGQTQSGNQFPNVLPYAFSNGYSSPQYNNQNRMNAPYMMQPMPPQQQQYQQWMNYAHLTHMPQGGMNGGNNFMGSPFPANPTPSIFGEDHTFNNMPHTQQHQQQPTSSYSFNVPPPPHHSTVDSRNVNNTSQLFGSGFFNNHILK